MGITFRSKVTISISVSFFQRMDWVKSNDRWEYTPECFGYRPFFFPAPSPRNFLALVIGRAQPRADDEGEGSGGDAPGYF